MKETVTQPKHAWMVTVAVAGVAVLYFALLRNSSFAEPGENLDYNLQTFEDLDNVESAYAEQPEIPCKVENPRALATSGGKIYVGALDSILVFTEDGTESDRFAVKGTPNCLAIDSDGSAYAGVNNAIAVLNPDGTERTTWTPFNDRTFLTSIGINGEDVYAADAGNRVVYRLSKNGEVQTTIGKKDEARDIPGIEAPSPYLDLALNPDHELWVVNPGELGLEQYREDGSLVTSWYRPTVLALEGFPGCCNPTHIAFNSTGDLLTCEKGMVRVKKFEVTAGEFEGLVASSEMFPQEQSLRDLAVDSRDRVLVLDAKRGAIRVFASKETPHGTAS